ncbi:hypothetical protein [Erythrobacter donghaensis]|uniref:hypothetical protein n=1 Tax=Erythrobacter donghaensis TaxID=267135 RepID=UPI000A3915F7|nr:hypothetical protein [Erythrobacter donghaensis]
MAAIGALCAAVFGFAFGLIGQSMATAEQVEADRNRQAVALYSQYEAMTLETRSASSFAEKRGGEFDDFLKIYRHFRHLATLDLNDDVSSSKIASLYQGRLRYWGGKFVDFSQKDGRSKELLTESEMQTMTALGNYLFLIHEVGQESNFVGRDGRRKMQDLEQEKSRSADELEDYSYEAAADDAGAESNAAMEEDPAAE